MQEKLFPERNQKQSQKQKRKGSTTEHNRITRDTVTLLGYAAKHLCTVWEHPTGMAWRTYPWGKIPVRFGFKGSPDIIGFTRKGIFLAIEIKTGSAVQQQNQKEFEQKLTIAGGIYLLARSPQQALELLQAVA